MFHIIFSADENYIKYTSVLITSIIKNTDTKLKFKDFCDKDGFNATDNSSFSSYDNLDFNALNSIEKDEGYIFHILSDKISQECLNKLFSLEKELGQLYPCKIIPHILDDKDFANFPISGAAHSNFLPYYRLKLSSFLDQSATKCLYLDSDMLCLFDIRELFAIDLKDYILAAINDPGSKKRKIKFKNNSKTQTHYFDNNYFNSGFLLINTKAYLEHQIEQKCQSLAQKCTYIKAADQDLLNAIIPSDKLLKLPIAYNFSSISFCFSICKDENPHRLNCTRAEFMQSYKEPKIIHYGEKPWKYLQSYTDSNGKNINDIWWDYATQTPAFDAELLKAKNSITEYLHFAALGFEVLRISKSIFGYFALKNLINNPQNDHTLLNCDIPSELFGLCCILGEMIIYARKHKKPALSVLLKVYKMKNTFKKYNTKQFV